MTWSGAYTPLENVLATPSVRLARALLCFDQAEPADLFDALDVEMDDRDRFYAALRRLRQERKIERVGLAVRITELGRRWLAGQLRRGDSGVATDK